MANLKIYGQVVEIMQPQTGVTRDGQQWWSQAFIIEELETNYPIQSHFVLFGNHLTSENVEKIRIGNDITVSFNIHMRDRVSTDNKRFINTELRAWKIEQGDTTKDVKPQAKKDGEFVPQFANTDETF